MFRKLMFVNILALSIVSSAYAQNNHESKVFYRIGIGTVNFENSSDIYDSEYRGHLHYHEAGLTANLGLGYGTEKIRALGFFDPSIVDGIDGFSVLSIGAKVEVGVPKLKWLKLGGGAIYSHNHAKLCDDVQIYERAGLDTVWSPFWSITFLPRSEGLDRFFADIRVGRAMGGDIIQPQTGKPVADHYVSVSIGAHVKFK